MSRSSKQKAAAAKAAAAKAEVKKHTTIVTQEMLDDNKDLLDQGIAVGDEIEVEDEDTTDEAETDSDEAGDDEADEETEKKEAAVKSAVSASNRDQKKTVAEARKKEAANKMANFIDDTPEEKEPVRKPSYRLTRDLKIDGVIVKKGQKLKSTHPMTDDLLEKGFLE